MKTPLGRNQRLVLNILHKLSMGDNISAISYYGGSVSKTERCISIGRDCQLFYDVPWWIIDTRHGGAVFRQEHGERLVHNALRAYNGVLRSLIKKGVVIPLPTETITQRHYNDNEIVAHYPKTVRTKKVNIRFVVMNYHMHYV